MKPEACIAIAFAMSPANFRCDPEPAPAAPIEVVCALRPNTTCTADNLTAALVPALRAAAAGDTTVRLWASSTTAVTDKLADSLPYSPPSRGSDKVKQRHLQDWAKGEANRLASFIAPVAAANAASIDQPLANAVAQVGLSGERSKPRHLIVVSDGRHVGVGHRRDDQDLDCKLIDPEDFQLALGRTVLLPKTLSNVTVHFAFVSLAKPRRANCAMSPRKAQAHERAWSLALTRAGAVRVVFSTGAPEFDAPE